MLALLLEVNPRDEMHAVKMSVLSVLLPLVYFGGLLANMLMVI